SVDYRDLHSFPTRRSSDSWCNTLATLRPVSDRECRAVSDWRRFGHKSRLGPAQSDCSDDSTLYAAVRSRLSLEPTCASESRLRTDRKSTRLNSSHVAIPYA